MLRTHSHTTSSVCYSLCLRVCVCAPAPLVAMYYRVYADPPPPAHTRTTVPRGLRNSGARKKSRCCVCVTVSGAPFPPLLAHPSSPSSLPPPSPPQRCRDALLIFLRRAWRAWTRAPPSAGRDLWAQFPPRRPWRRRRLRRTARAFATYARVASTTARGPLSRFPSPVRDP